MPDENDIPFNDYSVDFFGFLDYFFRSLFGGGTSSNGVVGNSGVNAGWSPSDVINLLSHIWSVFVVLSWLVSILLLFGLIYAYIRHGQLSEAFAEILKRQEETFVKLNSKDIKNSRWNDVQTHIESDRPNDWKLAIIEADIVLEELLETLGYAGASVGDKLKSAPPASFTTLNQAWRAHNVRNRIAHDGADFDLSKKLAQETVAQYKMVFDEFNFV